MVLIGPGLIDVDETGALLDLVVDVVGDGTALVVDAYALGALAQRPGLLHGRETVPVLTPNVGEGALLLGRGLSDDLVAAASEVAEKYQCVVSLFGHVAAPDGSAWQEEVADAGLGTSGSGDVAAGLLAGLRARGAEPAQAACWAAHVHASAGQRLALKRGSTNYLAREIADHIGLELGALG